MLRQILLSCALAFGAVTATVIAPSAACAQEQISLRDKINAEISRLEKKEKTEEECVRLADLYDPYFDLNEEKKEKLLQLIKSNPEQAYLKALECALKKDFDQASKMFEELAKSKADKRTRSNAQLRKLSMTAPKDTTEEDYLAVLKADDTNMMAYAKLLEHQTYCEINGFARAHSKLPENKRDSILDTLVSKYKKLFDDAIKKAEKLAELDKGIFKTELYDEFAGLVYSAINETASKKLQYARILDTCLEELTALSPAYKHLVLLARNLMQLYDADKKETQYERAIVALENASAFEKTGEIEYIKGDWYSKKADADKAFAKKAIEAYETAIKAGLNSTFEGLAKRKIERMKKKLE